MSIRDFGRKVLASCKQLVWCFWIFFVGVCKVLLAFASPFLFMGVIAIGGILVLLHMPFYMMTDEFKRMRADQDEYMRKFDAMSSEEQDRHVQEIRSCPGWTPPFS